MRSPKKVVSGIIIGLMLLFILLLSTLKEGTIMNELWEKYQKPKPDYAKMAREDGILTIVLDPGHGGSQLGAYYTWDDVTYYEKDINLRIATYIKLLLSQYKDINVLMTRESDKDMELSDRSRFARENLADVMISVHNNASETHLVWGCMVLVTSTHWQPKSATVDSIYQVSEDLGKKFVEKWKEVGITISNDSTTDMDGMFRRLHPKEKKPVVYPNGDYKDYYAIVRSGVEDGIPSIILEHAYMDYESDFKNYLMTNEQLYKLAKADCKAIAEYYQLEKRE